MLSWVYVDHALSSTNQARRRFGDGGSGALTVGSLASGDRVLLHLGANLGLDVGLSAGCVVVVVAFSCVSG